MVLGAFGAHGIEKMVDAKVLATYKMGIHYQFYHSFALIAAGMFAHMWTEMKLIFTIMALVQKKFSKIRGTLPKKIPSIKHTPVFYKVSAINKTVVTHFFFHSHEAYGGRKPLLDKLVAGVKKREYIAVAY